VLTRFSAPIFRSPQRRNKNPALSAPGRRSVLAYEGTEAVAEKSIQSSFVLEPEEPRAGGPEGFDIARKYAGGHKACGYGTWH